jgi:hypothetical protein
MRLDIRPGAFGGKRGFRYCGSLFAFVKLTKFLKWVSSFYYSVSLLACALSE